MKNDKLFDWKIFIVKLKYILLLPLKWKLDLFTLKGMCVNIQKSWAAMLSCNMFQLSTMERRNQFSCENKLLKVYWFQRHWLQKFTKFHHPHIPWIVSSTKKNARLHKFLSLPPSFLAVVVAPVLLLLLFHVQYLQNGAFKVVKITPRQIFTTRWKSPSLHQNFPLPHWEGRFLPYPCNVIWKTLVCFTF